MNEKVTLEGLGLTMDQAREQLSYYEMRQLELYGNFLPDNGIDPNEPCNEQPDLIERLVTDNTGKSRNYHGETLEEFRQ